MASSAFNADNVGQFDFAEKINSASIPLLRDLDSHKNLLSLCRPGMAPRVLEDLVHFEADYVARSYTAKDPMPLKPLAIWILSGHDFSQLMRHIHPDLRHIAGASGSNHGRLQLTSKEPDLLDVIGRDPAAQFFGISGDTAAAA